MEDRFAEVNFGRLPTYSRQRFFMVLRADDHNLGAKKRWASLSDAQEEARRLCQKERVPFIILQTILMVSLPDTPLKWEGM